MGVRLAALRRARPGLAARHLFEGPFNLLADGPYDEDVDTTSRELDVEKRARLTRRSPRSSTTSIAA